MSFDSPAKATGCGAKDDSIDVGEVDRIQADETSVINVSDVQASVDVTGKSSRDAAVGSAKFGLFVARLKRVAGSGEERQNAGSAPIGITGIECEEEIV